MGRPTKLNAVTQDKIIQALEAGNYFDVSCEYAGVSKVSGYAWRNRGKAELERRENPNVKEGSIQWEKEQPFVDFLNATTKASANVEIRTIASIQKSGLGDAERDGDWRALTWFMEHRYPKKWGKQYSESKNENDNTYTLIYPKDD